jgi:hypothetical protein
VAYGDACEFRRLGITAAAGGGVVVAMDIASKGCGAKPKIKKPKSRDNSLVCKLSGAIGAATSFEAGTLVRTKAGLKPIEHIQVGDEVAAWDEATGQIQYQKVTERYGR